MSDKNSGDKKRTYPRPRISEAQKEYRGASPAILIAVYALYAIAFVVYKYVING